MALGRALALASEAAERLEEVVPGKQVSGKELAVGAAAAIVGDETALFALAAPLPPEDVAV